MTFCNKTPHKTAKDARRHMAHVYSTIGKKKGAQGAKARVYCCDICGYWHFGRTLPDGRIRRHKGKTYVFNHA